MKLNFKNCTFIFSEKCTCAQAVAAQSTELEQKAIQALDEALNILSGTSQLSHSPEGLEIPSFKEIEKIVNGGIQNIPDDNQGEKRNKTKNAKNADVLQQFQPSGN